MPWEEIDIENKFKSPPECFFENRKSQGLTLKILQDKQLLI